MPTHMDYATAMLYNGLHTIGLLFIYRMWKDGRLGWLIYRRKFAHKVVTYQRQIGRRAGKVRQPKTDVLTAELSHHGSHYVGD